MTQWLWNGSENIREKSISQARWPPKPPALSNCCKKKDASLWIISLCESLCCNARYTFYQRHAALCGPSEDFNIVTGNAVRIAWCKPRWIGFFFGGGEGGCNVSQVTEGLEKVNETDLKSLGHMVGGAVIIFLLVICAQTVKKNKKQSPSWFESQTLPGNCCRKPEEEVSFTHFSWW